MLHFKVTFVQLIWKSCVTFLSSHKATYRSIEQGNLESSVSNKEVGGVSGVLRGWSRPGHHLQRASFDKNGTLIKMVISIKEAEGTFSACNEALVMGGEGHHRK